MSRCASTGAAIDEITCARSPSVSKPATTGSASWDRRATCPERWLLQNEEIGGDRRAQRKRTIRYDKDRYRDRHLIENTFCRLKDFRRVAIRYDKLFATFLSGVAIATALALWLQLSLSPNTTLAG